jgi:hypothetical protein
MKIQIEIEINMDAENNFVSVETNTRLDNVQRAKMEALEDHLKAFCEWFKEEAKTLQ